MADRFGIYVHIPYCYSKCSYCDFNSFPMGGSGSKGPYAPAALRLAIPQFVRALTSEIRGAQSLARGEVTSVYFGGGTPTALSPSQLAEILAAIRSTYTVAPDAEITLEANPESLAVCMHEPLMAAGFNRISIGLQSTDRKVLKTLGRPHGASEALAAVAQSCWAGWGKVSIDLIYGVPGQSIESWRKSLSDAVALAPDHISLYGLSVHAGTPMAATIARKYGDIEEWEKLSEDGQAEHYEEAVRFLPAAGFDRYETSNFARPGSECRHNLLCWQAGSYVGFGPGAHSHVAAADRSQTLSRRWENVTDIHRYIELAEDVEPPHDAVIQDAAVIEGRHELTPPLASWVEELSTGKQMSEAVFLALRLEKGLELAAFRRRFGREFGEVFPEQNMALQKDGLLIEENGHIRLAPEAHLLANYVMSEFV